MALRPMFLAHSANLPDRGTGRAMLMAKDDGGRLRIGPPQMRRLRTVPALIPARRG